MSSLPLLGDRYQLVERLGEGGMSTVWRGYDEALGRSVAVKLLTAGYAADNASRARIRAEGRIAAGLSHPHICRVFDYGEAITDTGDFVPYLVMELLPGATLADQLRTGPMPVRAALRTCAQVASALATAHRCGLVHRDIKPGNIMLTPNGPKVVDFGIAAAAGEVGEPRADGEIWATPGYVAPERLTGGEVLPASDVYALGLLLYRALAGRAPWRAGTVTEILTAHAEWEPEPLPERTGVPVAVRELCLRCLLKDPHQRPPAAEVAESLARAGGWRLSALAEGGLPVAPRGAVPAGDPAVPPAARHPGDRARFAQALVAGGAAARRRWPEPPQPGAITVRLPVPAGPASAGPAAAGPAAGRPAAGRPGQPGPGRTERREAAGGPLRRLRRPGSRQHRHRWAAATVASLVAVVTAVWMVAWVPTASGDRYLGFDVMAAPPVPGPDDTGGGEPGSGVGAPERSPTSSVMASGGGGGAPADQATAGETGSSRGGSGPAGSATGAGPGAPAPSSSGPGSGTESGPGPTGSDPSTNPPSLDPSDSGSPSPASPDTSAPSPSPPGDPSPSPLSPEPTAETFLTIAGPVEVTCSGGLATLTTEIGGSPVTVGPAPEVAVSLLGLAELRYTCAGGVPVQVP